jgi:hypothetical protein
MKPGDALGRRDARVVADRSHGDAHLLRAQRHYDDEITGNGDRAGAMTNVAARSPAHGSIAVLTVSCCS